MKNQKLVTMLFFFLGLAGTVNGQDSLARTPYLQHVLLFDWKDTVEQEKKEVVLDLFKGLPKQIKGFEQISIEEITKSSGNFDIILIMKFMDEKSLNVYEKHPDHKKISEIAPPLLNGFAEFDFYGKF